MLDNSLKLKELAKQAKKTGIRKLFDNKSRVNDFTHSVGDSAELFFDFSKTHITEAIVNAYLKKSIKKNVIEKRQQLFTGHQLNFTESRAVLHTALRDNELNDIAYINKQDKQKAIEAQQTFFDLVASVRAQIAENTLVVKDIIHIGIGGSFLGPKMLYEALVADDEQIKLHFISNVDAHELKHVVSKCNADSTLVVAVSKTFTTLETMTNLDSVLDWMKSNGVNNDYMQRVFAVSANVDKALARNIHADNVVEFPTWVGGRYSLWSAVSFSVALLTGEQKFKELLRGAEEMDKHFLTQALENNVCFIAAIMDHFYANHFGADTRATFAYDFRLRSFIDYLQQLETESNGKDRNYKGEAITKKTSPIIWGGVGTDVQHSVFQLIHQGTHVIPAEFVLIKKVNHGLEHHHTQLLANGLAQPAALLAGQALDEIDELAGDKLTITAKKAKIFSGNRPSSTILISELNAHTLGMLIAFYEHRTFVYGVLCGVNSYDQMGVELGKRLAKEVGSLLDNKNTDADSSWQCDPSTQQLLDLIKKQ